MLIMKDGIVQPAKLYIAPRQAVVMNLDDLEPLAKEYLADIGGNDDLNVRLTLSSFIAWLRQRQRESVVDARPVRNLSDVTRELDQQR